MADSTPVLTSFKWGIRIKGAFGHIFTFNYSTPSASLHMPDLISDGDIPACSCNLDI